MKKPTGYEAALLRRTRYALDLEARLDEIHGALKSLSKKGPTPEVRLFAAILACTADLTQPFVPSRPTKKAKTP